MSLNETPIVQAEMQIAKLSLADDAELVFARFDEDTQEYVEVHRFRNEDDWDAVRVDNLAVATNFVRCRIIDFDGLRDLIRDAQLVLFDGERWVIKRADPPVGVTRVWLLRLERQETT